MYSLEFTNKAENFLKKLEKKDKEVILRKLYSIRENPFPHIKRLQGSKLWRLRIMDFRAILNILISGQKIIVLTIGKRENVYD